MGAAYTYFDVCEPLNPAAVPDVFAALFGISPETNAPISNVPSPLLVFTIPFVVVFNFVDVSAVPAVVAFPDVSAALFQLLALET